MKIKMEATTMSNELLSNRSRWMKACRDPKFATPVATRLQLHQERPWLSQGKYSPGHIEDLEDSLELRSEITSPSEATDYNEFRRELGLG